MNTIDEKLDILEKKLKEKELGKIFNILTDEEIDALLNVVLDEEVLDDELLDDELRKFSFVEVMSWINRTHKGYSDYPQKISKKSWASNQFIFYVQGSTFKVNRAPLLGIFEEGTEISYCPHIDMHLPNGKIVVWTPTTDDMFSEDYYIKDLNTGKQRAILPGLFDFIKGETNEN